MKLFLAQSWLLGVQHKCLLVQQLSKFLEVILHTKYSNLGHFALLAENCRDRRHPLS